MVWTRKNASIRKEMEVSKTWLPYYVVHKKVFRACQKTSRKTILEGKIEGKRRRGRPLRRWRKGDWGTSRKLEEWRKIGLCFVSLCEQRSDRMWLSFTTMKRWRFIMQFAVAKNHFIAFFLMTMIIILVVIHEINPWIFRLTLIYGENLISWLMFNWDKDTVFQFEFIRWDK